VAAGAVVIIVGALMWSTWYQNRQNSELQLKITALEKQAQENQGKVEFADKELKMRQAATEAARQEGHGCQTDQRTAGEGQEGL